MTVLSIVGWFLWVAAALVAFFLFPRPRTVATAVGLASLGFALWTIAEFVHKFQSL